MHELVNGFCDVRDSTDEPWDVFDITEPPSVAKAWIAFGLTITGCAIAGLATGAAVAALIGKRVFDAVTSR